MAKASRGAQRCEKGLDEAAGRPASFPFCHRISFHHLQFCWWQRSAALAGKPSWFQTLRRSVRVALEGLDTSLGDGTRRFRLSCDGAEAQGCGTVSGTPGQVSRHLGLVYFEPRWCHAMVVAEPV